jgi:predicted metal-dependent phosphoesterase TrpH
VWLKGNLHAHSIFSDGIRPPEEVVAAYESLGYDFLALTDHDDRVPPDYWHALAGLRSSLILFHGIEIDYTPLSQHVGQVHGDREVLHVLNHPARYALSLDETLRRIEVISGDGLRIDAVEVTDTGLYRPEYDTDAIRLPKVATDDSHRELHWGRAWIEVEARRDRDAILRAIKAGDFRLGFAAAGPAR